VNFNTVAFSVTLFIWIRKWNFLTKKSKNVFLKRRRVASDKGHIGRKNFPYFVPLNQNIEGDAVAQSRYIEGDKKNLTSGRGRGR